MPRSSHQSACLQHRPPARGIKRGSFRFEVPAGGSGLALYAMNPNETGIALDRVVIEVLGQCDGASVRAVVRTFGITLTAERESRLRRAS